MAHLIAVIIGVVLLLVGLGLLIWGVVRHHREQPGTRQTLTMGLMVGGGVLALIGLFVLIAGLVVHPHHKTVVNHTETHEVHAADTGDATE